MLGSDVLYLAMPRIPTVILNSFEVASELFEKREYADKPRYIMNELYVHPSLSRLTLPVGTRRADQNPAVPAGHGASRLRRTAHIGASVADISISTSMPMRYFSTMTS